MKLIISIFTIVIIMAMVMHAQIPSARSNLSIEIKEIGTSHREDTTWQSGDGSYERYYSGFKEIGYRVTNIGRSEESCTVTAYFFVKKLHDQKRKVICMIRNEHKHIAPMQFVEDQFGSGEIKSYVLNFATLGDQWVSGAKNEGWIVVMSNANGDSIAVKGSTPTLQDIASHSLKLAEFADDYTKSKNNHVAR